MLLPSGWAAEKGGMDLLRMFEHDCMWVCTLCVYVCMCVGGITTSLQENPRSKEHLLSITFKNEAAPESLLLRFEDY